jgi:hypothetical protein
MIEYQKDTIRMTADSNPKRVEVIPNDNDAEAKILAFFANVKSPVPQSVTPLQMRKALREAGLKPMVDGFLTSIDEQSLEEWEYATSIDRANATIAMAAGLMGMTDEQVDDLFRLASGM